MIEDDLDIDKFKRDHDKSKIDKILKRLERERKSQLYRL